MKREEFIWNKLVRSAVVRQLEIIREAAGSVSDELKSKYASIPWRIIKDFRNVLAHHYFGIDYNEVFTVLEVELPKLKDRLKLNLKLIKFTNSNPYLQNQTDKIFHKSQLVN